MRVPPLVLSIAGYDPSSGAGITADIKTAAALGCYAVTCITALTVQSTQGVFGVQSLAPELVARALEALADDVEIAAVRLGMLGSGAVAATVRDFLRSRRLPNVVLDPVIASSSGHALLDDAGIEVVREMLPLCDVITPNIHEAAVLAGTEMLIHNANWHSAMRQLAGIFYEFGAKAVVITGGDLDPPKDFLVTFRSGNAEEEILPGERIESRSTHGTGCAFATALACRLALGDTLPEAVRAAKDYVRQAIVAAYPLGKGIGPVNHFG
ncbi:MAG: bifunctional hydroxymethylpyrimidine kinase/phosphomethylpyrimidine kinase [Candidatus Korobacteraceae bacterium]